MTRDEFLKSVPGLVKDYQASAQVLAHIKYVDLLMIVGGTGVGKTSIIKRLGVPYVLSDTTRPIRPWEINGLDYFFRTDYDQLLNEIKERKFVQVNIFSTGDFYGTRASAFPELGFAVYAVVAEKITEFRKLGFNETICAFVTPPSFTVWMEWLEKNNFERDQLVRRLAEARRSYQFALSDHNTSFILNDELDQAVRQTNELLNGKRNMDRENRARESAEQIYKELTAAS